jgi:hypothetical protein
MKTLVSLLLFAALAHAGQAQAPDPSNPPGVELVKHSWSKERIDWERDPFAGVLESFDDARMRMRNEKRIEDAKRAGSPEADKIRREAKADEALIRARHQGKTPRYVFAYKASVKNGGAKAIKEIDWDYVFFDAATGEELGRHQFTSEGKIGPGKRKELSFLISSPPTRTVSVYSLNDKEHDAIRGQVILLRVAYDDGSAWRRP